MKGSSNYESPHDSYKKRGRKEMRTIKISSSARSNKKYDRYNDKEDDSTVKAELESESEVSEVEKEEIDDSEKKKKVYGALLTILESEHPEKKKRKTKPIGNEKDENLTSKSESESEVDEEQEIENGLNSELEDDEEDDNVKDAEIRKDLEEESDDEQDPFEIHFNQVPEDFINKIYSGFENKQVKYKSIKVVLNEDESCIYSKPVLVADEETKIESPILKSSLNSYFIKQRLKVHNDLLDTSNENLTPLQKNLVDSMFQYKDILQEYSTYGKDEKEYRDLYVLHILNHIYKTRDKILKDNQRLQDNPDTEYLDQGFTRPKVLIVVPTRDTAYQVVNTIIQKSGLDQVDQKAKFKGQFFEDSLPPTSKPQSFQEIFKGNTNDFFVLGIKFTRKTIKLYSNFYQSDVIVCSPLGLQMIIENTDKKKRQDDFLSSIEITIFDQLHSLEYQNVSHIMTIFDHINKIPQQQREADFSRIRMWYINDQARLFRQTMVFTKYVSPMANALINGKCRNLSGRWKNYKKVLPESSSIGQLGLKIRQIFQRFNFVGGSIIDEPDYRFKYFTSVVIQSIVKSTGYEDGILVYIPEYTDYIRLRNYMKDKTTILFGDINEYSDQKQLNSNRSLFQQGRVKVLLYTERLHHYRRYEIKGVKSVIFYKPPTNPEFYNEVVRYIGKNAFLGNTDLNISTVRTIYSKLDGLALERVVGSKRAAVLCHGQNEVFEFK